MNAGKILADEKSIEEYKISEKDFLVVMVSKPKAVPTPKPVEPVAEPVAVAAPVAAAPAPVAAPVAAAEPAVAAAAPEATSTTTENASGDSQLGKQYMCVLCTRSLIYKKNSYWN